MRALKILGLGILLGLGTTAVTYMPPWLLIGVAILVCIWALCAMSGESQDD